MWSVIALVATLAALTCPAQAQMGRRRYCGSTLADMLSLVCGGRFYSGSEKRSQTELEVAHGGTDEHVVRRRRSVVDACCNNSCSLAVLESYCEEPTAWRNAGGLFDKVQEGKPQGSDAVQSSSERLSSSAASRQVYDMFKSNKPFFFLIPQSKRSSQDNPSIAAF